MQLQFATILEKKKKSIDETELVKVLELLQNSDQNS